MAKRTPDYTKQVRHEKPPRRPVAAAPRRTQARRPQVPPMPRGVAGAVLLSLVGGAAVYVYGAFLAIGSDAKSTAFFLGISLVGVLTNVLTAVLAMYALAPQRHPMPRIDKRLLAVAIVTCGAISVFFSFSRRDISFLSAGLIPPVAIFFFVIRPRLKVIAEVAGTYRPTRRDQALEEIRERRELRQREKEHEAAVKRTLRRRLQRGTAPGDEAESEIDSGSRGNAGPPAGSRQTKRHGGRR